MKRRNFLQSVVALGTFVASPFVRKSHASGEPVKAATWHVPIDAPCNRYARLQRVSRSSGLYQGILLMESYRCRRNDQATSEALARNRSLVAASALMDSPCWCGDNTLRFSGLIDYQIAQQAIGIIGRNTFGALTMDAELVWVMNPTTAVLHGAVIPGGNVRHLDCRIPEFLHGIPLVVEDAVGKGQYIIQDRDAFLLTRVTDVSYSGPRVSTLTLFMLEDGTAEHYRGKVNIVDDFDCRVTAPVSGVYLKGW